MCMKIVDFIIVTLGYGCLGLGVRVGESKEGNGNGVKNWIIIAYKTLNRLDLIGSTLSK